MTMLNFDCELDTPFVRSTPEPAPAPAPEVEDDGGWVEREPAPMLIAFVDDDDYPSLPPKPRKEPERKPVLRNERKTHVLKPCDQWGADEIREYVIGEIESRFGAFPRDPRKEHSIFNSFTTRFGDKAPLIARASFEVFEGWWNNAPISINRFCKASDPYFGDVILDKIPQTTIESW